MSAVETVWPQTQSRTTRASALRWRLALTCGLMVISLMAATMLARVTADQAPEVRGASEWMTSPWAWWFGVPVLWWVVGLTGTGALTTCLAIIGCGGRWTWGVLISLSLSLLGIGLWYMVGVGLISNPEFIRSIWHATALAGGGVGGDRVAGVSPDTGGSGHVGCSIRARQRDSVKGGCHGLRCRRLGADGGRSGWPFSGHPTTRINRNGTFRAAESHSDAARS